MIEQIDKEYVLHTYARNYVNFKKGVNATLFDENEKDYIDFTFSSKSVAFTPFLMKMKKII